MRENEVTRARKRLHEAILADLRLDDHSYMDLAIRHGVSMPTVIRVARANGIRRKDAPGHDALAPVRGS